MLIAGADAVLRFPFFRQWLLWMGGVSASREAVAKAMKSLGVKAMRWNHYEKKQDSRKLEPFLVNKTGFGDC